MVLAGWAGGRGLLLSIELLDKVATILLLLLPYRDAVDVVFFQFEDGYCPRRRGKKRRRWATSEQNALGKRRGRLR